MNRRSCEDVRALLPLVLEHEAEPLEALEAAAHISACPPCEREAERGRSVVAALRGSRLAGAGRDVAGGVLAALRAARERLPEPRALKWSSLGLLALLAAAWASVPSLRAGGGAPVLARLGELLEMDVVAGRVAEALARLLTAPGAFLAVLARGGEAGAQAAGASAAPALAGLLLLGALGAAFLSGAALLGGAAAAPWRRLLRRCRRLF